jgi:hypothetical protein
MLKRLWKLGSIEHKVLPTDESVGKFVKGLKQAVEEGSENLINGPFIEVINLEQDDHIEEYLIYDIHIDEDNEEITVRARKVV